MIEKLEIYPVLSAEERRVVDAYVDSHPHLKPQLLEARRLAQMIDEVRRKQFTAEDVAFAAAHAAVEPDAPAYDPELERAIQSDPELSALYAEYREGVRSIEQDLDPIAHFERLRRQSALPAADGKSSVVREPIRRRSAMRLLRSPAAWSIAASLAVVTILGTLIAVDMGQLNELERLGEFREDELNTGRYTMTPRSTDTFRLTRTDSLLIDAVVEIRDARQMRLGVLRGYDSARLDRADSLLTVVIDALPDENFVALEARYLRGKAALLRQQPDAAMRDLNVVVQHEGARSPRARDVLSRLEAGSRSD